MLKDKIKNLAKAYKEEVIQTRRQLHANPELSFQEFKTAAFVKERLEELGINQIESKAETGW
jgi:metal-dependent amidase/aminoacylase/carboxypeptidase family protein